MSINAVLGQLSVDGYCEFPNLFCPKGTQDLLGAIKATRTFDESLFLSEEEWEASPKTHKHTNPGPGYNVLEKFPEKLDFIEKNPHLVEFLTALLGHNYRILTRKIVGRLSWAVVPEWVQRITWGKPSNTYGAFIKPQYRDIFYLLDAEMHQDIQDYSRLPLVQKDHRFITFYVYLDEVTEYDGPVQLLPGTHRLGVTPYQHNIHYTSDKNKWLYKDPQGNCIESDLKSFIGKAGHAGIWHSCLVHGAPPVKDGHLRISLRYIIARSEGTDSCAIDEINQQVQGSLYPEVDYTPGYNASSDGSWNLQISDYFRLGYEKMQNVVNVQ